MKHILIVLALSLNVFASVTPEQLADTLLFQNNPVNTACMQHLKLSIKEDWEKAGGGSALIAIVKDVRESEALQFKAIKLTHDRVRQILYLHLSFFLTAINMHQLPVSSGELRISYRHDAYMHLFKKHVEEPSKKDAFELWHTFLQGKIPAFYESAIRVAHKEYEDYLNLF